MKKVKITSIAQMKASGKEVSTRDYIITFGEIFIRYFIDWDEDRNIFEIDGGIDDTQIELTEEQLASDDFCSIAQAIKAGNFYEEVDEYTEEEENLIFGN